MLVSGVMYCNCNSVAEGESGVKKYVKKCVKKSIQACKRTEEAANYEYRRHTCVRRKMKDER